MSINATSWNYTAINISPKKTCFTIFHVEFMISINESYMVIIFLNYKEQHDLHPTMRKTVALTHSCGLGKFLLCCDRDHAVSYFFCKHNKLKKFLHFARKAKKFIREWVSEWVTWEWNWKQKKKLKNSVLRLWTYFYISVTFRSWPLRKCRQREKNDQKRLAQQKEETKERRF